MAKTKTKSVDDAFAAAKTLPLAQKLYAQLGDMLNRPDDVGMSSGARKVYRAKIKEMRRALEERWGDQVRLMGATAYQSLEGPVGTAKVTMPSWMRRGHFTVRKPDPKSLKSPSMLFIPLDERSLAPIGVYYSTTEQPNALSRAMEQLESYRSRKRGRPVGRTAKEWRIENVREEMDELRRILRDFPDYAQEPMLEDEVVRLTQRLEQLQRELDQLTEVRRRPQGPLGQGSDGND